MGFYAMGNVVLLAFLVMVWISCRCKTVIRKDKKTA